MTGEEKKQLITLLAGVLVALLGLVVCAGWLTGSVALVHVLPKFAGMQMNTALGFVLSGVALATTAFRWPGFAKIAAGTVFLLSSLTLFEYLSGIDIGLDTLFVDPAENVSINNPYPGRMGLNTALSFMLFGGAVFLLQIRPFYWKLVLLVVFGSVVLVLACSVLLGYFSSLVWKSSWQLFTQMAVHTALGFVVLSVGLFGAVGPAIRKDHVSEKNLSRLLFGSFHAWLILVVSLSFSLGLWYLSSMIVMGDALSRFKTITARISAAVQRRIDIQEQMLSGAKGLLLASERVSREEWYRYVEAQRLSERYPGVQGIGFSRKVAVEEKAEFIQSMRDQGFPEFDIRPEGIRDEYHAVVYLEPFDVRNRRAFGYDMYSEPVRRQAMQRARDTGKTTLSGKVTLVQENQWDVQPGFLMYAPVYKNSMALFSTEVRRKNLLGFIYSPFRVNNLMRGIVELQNSNVAVAIYDGAAADEARLLYSTIAGASVADSGQPVFIETRTINVAGRDWTLIFQNQPRFLSGFASYQPKTVLWSGLVISALLFGVVWSLSTNRVRAQLLADNSTRKLVKSEERFRRLVQESLGFICSHDLTGKIIYVNPAAASSLGYIPEELEGVNLRELIKKEIRKDFDSYLERVIRNGRDSGMMAVITKDGRERVWTYDNACHESEDDKPYILGHAQDVTELQEARWKLETAHAKMKKLATQDTLTGLCNRTLLMEYLHRFVSQAKRYRKKLSVCFLDLNGFKEINDTLGHDVGDSLLQYVANVLQKCVRVSDVVARLGGDEFVLLLTDIADLAAAIVIAERISAELERTVTIDGHNVVVSTSIGIACYPFHAKTPDALLKCADQAMYQSKRDKSNYQIYSPAED